MAWSDTVDVADEYFHEPSSDPYWSENSLLGFSVPELTLKAINRKDYDERSSDGITEGSVRAETSAVS